MNIVILYYEMGNPALVLVLELLTFCVSGMRRQNYCLSHREIEGLGRLFTHKEATKDFQKLRIKHLKKIFGF